MSSNPYQPTDAESVEWDAVIIGTGMGGSTAGYELARRGLRVLFLEKGRFLFGDADRGDGRLPSDDDNRPDVRLDRARWPHPIEGSTSLGEREFYAPLGCGTGGTSSLYAAQLERFLPQDFEPRRHFPDVPDANLPERWPIGYDELAPHYAAAERLYRVCGTQDPLNDTGQDSLREPPPLSPRDQDLHDSFRELGLHPYRAHVGYEFVPDCGECGGVMCPRACKSDSGRVCLMPAVTQHGAKVLSDCEVLELVAGPDRVEHVRCIHGGKELRIRARAVVLAAGAYMSPVLLLNSRSEHWPKGLANHNDMVGRNLMLHTSDFVAVRPRRNLSDAGPKKALALNDFYTRAGTKLGTFQSVGIAVDPGYVLYHLRSQADAAPRWWLKLLRPALRIVAVIAAFYFRKAAMFATIVEDLPYLHNRIVPDAKAKSGMRFEYHYPEELLARNRLFRKELKAAMGRRHGVMVFGGDDNINYGHVCGTCRFGDDPETSVLDSNNRAHGVANLYVVDASFFPSSGGTNPSLTIAANALRVAGAIATSLEAPAAPDAGAVG